jgi:GH25 family lysozyme M1 (1,4-beta-N-acetylmuramidase)
VDRAVGIDVSHHHRVTDFGAVIDAGMSFFGAKATNGRAVDPTFLEHRNGARQQPFDLCLWYHFPKPGTPAIEQAANLLDTVGALRDNERLVLDVELDPLTNWCPDLGFVDAFVRAIATPDRRPLVYTSARVWQEYLGSPSWPAAVLCDLWAPRYGHDEPTPPRDAEGYMVWPGVTIWQDSESFECPGVDGRCDHNVFRGTVGELRTYAKLAGT